MAHTTNWTSNGCIVDVYGEITNEELAQIDAELSGSAKFDEIEYFVRDLSRVEKAALTAEELVCAAYINAVASEYKKKLRGAFIVNRPDTESNVRLYIQESHNAGCLWDQRMFKDHFIARAWAESGE